ncbi:MAG: prepilin-type N-terminal cleavage/methylation domain-containing protein [Saccharospirillaceae bacterium]|nr:prepilin-type N-terminal cleavage/methylation domain-containing protein [Pseudomonadales bacterium]NRB77907.1 prepilin-type N-terminal cleavage/methylation domain-containing protein [Saccharospirillaceae bacterium]
MTKLHLCGFTLIELIMVIVVLSILSAVTISKFPDTDIYDQRYFVDETISSIKYGAKKAKSSGCPVKLTLTSNSFNLSIDPLCSTNFIQTLTLQDQTTLLANSNTVGLVITSTVTEIVFHADFSITDISDTLLNTHPISFTSSQGLNQTLYLDGQTGFIYE